MSEEKQIEEMARTICGEKENDCIECDSNEMCEFYLEASILYNAGYSKQNENTVELPCKIGDTVYIIDECGDGECAEDYVLAVKVMQFFINKHGIAVDLELPLGLRQNSWMVVGKNIFLTEDEAEQALAKMKGGAE
jgi:hypothetical protein